MICCETLDKSFLFLGLLFFHLHDNYVGKVMSETFSTIVFPLLLETNGNIYIIAFKEDILLPNQQSCFVFHYHCLKQIWIHQM